MQAVLFRSSQQRGFALIELLIVITLIAVLAAIIIVVTRPNKNLADANNTAALQHLNTIHNALNQFQVDFERVPTQINTPAIIDTPREVCRDHIDAFTCAFNGYASLTELTPDYVADIPFDAKFASDRGTGYWVHVDKDGRFHAASVARGISVP